MWYISVKVSQSQWEDIDRAKKSESRGERGTFKKGREEKIK